MRTDHQIRRIPQRMIHGQRFRIRDINRSTTQRASLQRSNQRLLVEDLPTGDIRDIRSRERMLAVPSKKGKHIRANQLCSLRGKRDADNNVVKPQ